MLNNQAFRVVILSSFIIFSITSPAISYTEREIRGGSGSLNESREATTGPEDDASDGQEPVLLNKTESGPATNVPWENSEKFLNSQAENGTPIMMAAYRTVLHDPLPGEEENVHLAARLIAGTIIKPGEVFSQNNKAGPYIESKGYKKGPTYAGPNLITTIGGGVCKIASTLYNVAILSDLPVIERHAHSMPVPYVPYGQDATVSYGSKDMKFKNDTDSPILIWAQGVDNILYIAFYGVQASPTVEWHHDVLKVIKANKVYKINPSLPKGEEKLLLEGMDGAVVKSWITVKHPDGTEHTQQLRMSSYNPLPYLYERGN